MKYVVMDIMMPSNHKFFDSKEEALNFFYWGAGKMFLGPEVRRVIDSGEWDNLTTEQRIEILDKGPTRASKQKNYQDGRFGITYAGGTSFLSIYEMDNDNDTDLSKFLPRIQHY